MEHNPLFQLAGWCGYISAGATILGFITLIIFFVVGGPFGTMNDIASVAVALTGIPILVALNQLHRSASPILSWSAVVIGILSVLVAATTQSMLVLKVIKYEQSYPATVAFEVFGVSLMVYGILSYTHGVFSRSMSVWEFFAGLGYFLVTIGFLLGQQNHPLTYVGGLMSVIAFPAWAIMLGRVFLKAI